MWFLSRIAIQTKTLTRGNFHLPRNMERESIIGFPLRKSRKRFTSVNTRWLNVLNATIRIKDRVKTVKNIHKKNQIYHVSIIQVMEEKISSLKPDHQGD